DRQQVGQARAVVAAARARERRPAADHQEAAPLALDQVGDPLLLVVGEALAGIVAEQEQPEVLEVELGLGERLRAEDAGDGEGGLERPFEVAGRAGTLAEEQDRWFTQT